MRAEDMDPETVDALLERLLPADIAAEFHVWSTELAAAMERGEHTEAEMERLVVERAKYDSARVAARGGSLPLREPTTAERFVDFVMGRKP